MRSRIGKKQKKFITSVDIFQTFDVMVDNFNIAHKPADLRAKIEKLLKYLRVELSQ